MVTSVDVYKEIRRLQLEGVTSQRAAAKQLGISRNTVKKYWEGTAVPWDHKAYSRDAAVMTPDVVQFISACLDEDERERVKKQRHTASRIYQRLVEECDFSGSESSVQNLVHNMRAARKETKVFVPLRFAPGEAVQIDWGEATVYINGEKLVLNLFCARLCHSCAPYVNITTAERSFRRTGEYAHILQLVTRNEEKLTETLTEAQKETFEKFKDSTSEVSSIKYAEVKLWLDNFERYINDGSILNVDDSTVLKQLVDQIVVGDAGIEIQFKCGVMLKKEYE